jgi:hypothetical protein
VVSFKLQPLSPGEMATGTHWIGGWVDAQTWSGRYGEEKAAGPLASGTRTKKRFYLHFNRFVLVLEPKSNDVLPNIEVGRATAPGTSCRLPTAVGWVETWSRYLDICRVAVRQVFSDCSGSPASFHSTRCPTRIIIVRG